MARIAVTVSEETRAKLIELAGGEDKMGAYLDELIDGEYIREKVLEAAEVLVEEYDFEKRINALNNRPEQK